MDHDPKSKSLLDPTHNDDETDESPEPSSESPCLSSEKSQALLEAELEDLEEERRLAAEREELQYLTCTFIKPDGTKCGSPAMKPRLRKDRDATLAWLRKWERRPKTEEEIKEEERLAKLDAKRDAREARCYYHQGQAKRAKRLEEARTAKICMVDPKLSGYPQRFGTMGRVFDPQFSELVGSLELPDLDDPTAVDIHLSAIVQLITTQQAAPHQTGQMLAAVRHALKRQDQALRREMLELKRLKIEMGKEKEEEIEDDLT